MARALAAAIVASLLAVSGAGGATSQTPKRGGTLVFRYIGPQPACLNPLDIRCNPGQPVLKNLLENVLAKAFEVDASFTPRPQLATATFTRQRPFTLIYRIRPQARWSDGVPVTSRDFAFTLRAIRKHGTPIDRTLHSVVRSARAVNAKTLRVVLRPKHAGWRNLFGNVLPSHALQGQDLTRIWSARIDDPRTGNAIGSGPFLFERWERDTSLIVLRRNPNYWGPHRAYLDRLVVRYLTSPTNPTEELRRGELDIATGAPFDAVPAIRRTKGLRVSAATSSAFEHFELQLGPRGHPALRNKLVRRALAYAIDRVALARAIYGNVLPSIRPLESMVIVSGDRHYETNWRGYRFRPAEVRRLLQRAGCRRGLDGIYLCAGERLALRFFTNAGVPWRERTISVVQARLRPLGVEVLREFAAPSTFFNQILPGGTFDVALFSWVYEPGGSWGGVYGCDGQVNFSRYCHRLVTSDLGRADRILDTATRARMLNKIDRQLARDVPVIPLYQNVFTAAYRSDVRGYAMSPANPFWNAENWWLER